MLKWTQPILESMDTEPKSHIQELGTQAPGLTTGTLTPPIAHCLMASGPAAHLRGRR